jgi:hypothetical protein
MLRRSTLAILAVFVTACADNKPPSYYKPGPLVPLQDPLPGLAMVYLFRAPHDLDAFHMEIDQKPPFVLKPGSYTVLSFAPGEFGMRGYAVSRFGTKSPAFQPTLLRLREGQRIFLYVSGENDSSFLLKSIVPIGRGGVLVDGGIRTSTVAGTRSWKECNEIDAQGFISISKLQLIE